MKKTASSPGAPELELQLIRLRADTRARLRELARAEDRSVSSLVRIFVDQGIRSRVAAGRQPTAA
jgi:hypothetical protein